MLPCSSHTNRADGAGRYSVDFSELGVHSLINTNLPYLMFGQLCVAVPRAYCNCAMIACVFTVFAWGSPAEAARIYTSEVPVATTVCSDMYVGRWFASGHNQRESMSGLRFGGVRNPDGRVSGSAATERPENAFRCWWFKDQVGQELPSRSIFGTTGNRTSVCSHSKVMLLAQSLCNSHVFTIVDGALGSRFVLPLPLLIAGVTHATAVDRVLALVRFASGPIDTLSAMVLVASFAHALSVMRFPAAGRVTFPSTWQRGSGLAVVIFTQSFCIDLNRAIVV